MPACFAGYYALRHVPDTCMPLHLAVLCVPRCLAAALITVVLQSYSAGQTMLPDGQPRVGVCILDITTSLLVQAGPQRLRERRVMCPRGNGTLSASDGH
jgi:hypothetical protein